MIILSPELRLSLAHVCGFIVLHCYTRLRGNCLNSRMFVLPYFCRDNFRASYLWHRACGVMIAMPNNLTHKTFCCCPHVFMHRKIISPSHPLWYIFINAKFGWTIFVTGCLINSRKGTNYMLFVNTSDHCFGITKSVCSSMLVTHNYIVMGWKQLLCCFVTLIDHI